MFQRYGASPITTPLFGPAVADPDTHRAPTGRQVTTPDRSRREPAFCRLPHPDRPARGGDPR